MKPTAPLRDNFSELATSPARGYLFLVRSMRRVLITFSIAACLQAASSFGGVLVGPGPDPACGGTELLVEEGGGKIIRIVYTVYQSFRCVEEHYELLSDGDWRVTLLFYSSRWQLEQPLTPDRLIRKVVFRASRAESERRVLEEFGYMRDDWAAEPKRLINYYHSARSDFTPKT
jgi:hypothetical protein